MGTLNPFELFKTTDSSIFSCTFSFIFLLGSDTSLPLLSDLLHFHSPLPSKWLISQLAGHNFSTSRTKPSKRPEKGHKPSVQRLNQLTPNVNFRNCQNFFTSSSFSLYLYQFPVCMKSEAIVILFHIFNNFKLYNSPLMILGVREVLAGKRYSQ